MALQTPRPTFLAALTAFTILGAAACKSTSNEPPQIPNTSTSKTPIAAAQHPGHAEITTDVTAQAAVVTVDKATRLITLRREDGKMFTVEAGPEVRNFDQIAVGDTLRVRYQESLSATLMPAGTTLSPTEGALAAGRAKAGAKPAGGVGFLASARVKVESVDLERGVVVFCTSGGDLNAVRPVRPEGREFIKGLKLGDIVQLDYAVALALSVDKM
jgi:hypothetical protein